MFTLFLIITIIAFLLWIIGIITHALPGDLIQACLIIWIVFLVVLVVFAAFGHANFGHWGW